MGYFLQYLSIRVVLAIFRFLPYRLIHGIASFSGDLIYHLHGSRRRVAMENLDRVYGNSFDGAAKKRIARASFRHLAISLVELFVVERFLKNPRKYFLTKGFEHMDRSFAQGKGVVLVISHLGSWEYLSFLPILHGSRWSAVVKTIKNPYINREIVELRRKMTLNPIPKKGSVKEVLRELKQNHGVAVLIDQWAGREGLWQDFFGFPTSTTSIPVRLAVKTGCPLVPAYCIRLSPGRFEVQIHPPIFVDPQQPNVEEAVTARLTGLLEEQIKKYPEQWSWPHKRWKPKPEQVN
ncbi:MAG: lysophospholipid acyltransferase family protein [Candidatus Omnitrophica bacterium]|nr:lysophospholipid acyltransferase family protein [Candidatus Omnitrophota bacterium]